MFSFYLFCTYIWHPTRLYWRVIFIGVLMFSSTTMTPVLLRDSVSLLLGELHLRGNEMRVTWGHQGWCSRRRRRRRPAPRAPRSGPAARPACAASPATHAHCAPRRRCARSASRGTSCAHHNVIIMKQNNTDTNTETTEISAFNFKCKNILMTRKLNFIGRIKK